MSSFHPNWIVGKTIAHVIMNAVNEAKSGGGPMHDPLIVFTDGSSITFHTEESNDGSCYGTDIVYRKAAGKAARQIQHANQEEGQQ
jgi:hypothetical protein